MYEEICANIIGRLYSSRAQDIKFINTMRARHVRNLAFIYSKWRKKPFNIRIRNEVMTAINHRYTPANHRIKELGVLFEEENAHATKIQATVRMWSCKTKYVKKLTLMKQKEYRKTRKAVIRVQAIARALAAKRRVRVMLRLRTAKTFVAVFLQKMYRT